MLPADAGLTEVEFEFALMSILTEPKTQDQEHANLSVLKIRLCSDIANRSVMPAT